MKDSIKFETCENKSYCYINHNGITFYGEASCHPDDLDMQSERTGYFIAETRANIKLLQYKRDYEFLPLLKSYKHLYDCMSHCPQFNKTSYEAFCVRRHIQHLERDIAEIKAAITEEKEYLKNYIEEKEHVYQRIRLGKHP